MKALSIALLFLILTNVSAKNHHISKASNSNGKVKKSNLLLHHFKKNPGLPYLPIGKSASTQSSNSNWDYTLQLDSMVLVDDSKDEYTYNKNGDVTKIIIYEWDAGLWVNSIKYGYTYDNNGNMTFLNILIWDDGQWVNYYKYDLSYDNSNNMISWVYQSWEPDQWVNAGKHEYTYDNSGKLILYNQYTSSLDQWENNSKNEYVYDNNATLVLVYVWETDQWVNFQKIEYSYNNSGNIISSLWYDWEDSVWENTGKVEYTYNNIGNTTLYMYYTWLSEQWVNSEKIEYNYDNSNNMILHNEYRWEFNQWINSAKSEETYDHSVSILDVAYPNDIQSPDLLTWITTWYGSGNNNKLDSAKLFNWNDTTSSWDINFDIKYYYSPFIVPIFDDHPLICKNSTGPLSIKSNPTGSLLYLTNHSGSDIAVSIYSIGGKTAKRIIVPKSGMVLDVSSLSAGIYFVKFTGRSTGSSVASFVKWQKKVLWNMEGAIGRSGGKMNIQYMPRTGGLYNSEKITEILTSAW